MYPPSVGVRRLTLTSDNYTAKDCTSALQQSLRYVISLHSALVVTATIVMVANAALLRDRWLVVSLWRQGDKSFRGIARATGRSREFVRRWVHRFQETGDVQHKPRGGRPKLLTERGDRARLATAAAGSSVRATARALEASGRRASRMTVYRRMRELPLVYRVRPKKPDLRRSHKQARLRFARTGRPRRYWQRVVSADESSFCLSYGQRGEWVRPGHRPRPRRVQRKPVYIRVWAAVSWYGKTPLFQIPRSMSSGEFAAFLETKAIPAMSKIGGPEPRRWKLLHDHDGIHTAKITRKSLKNAGVTLVPDYPSRSPDLNILENVWAMLARGLASSTPQSERGLWAAMRAAWNRIPLCDLRNCVRSMPRRLREIESVRGDVTKY